jgi:hypothetical protein
MLACPAHFTRYLAYGTVVLLVKSVHPLTREGMRTCPSCAEEIQEAAIVCKHCGRDVPKYHIDRVPPPPSPRTAEGPKGSRSRLYLLLGLLALLVGYTLRPVGASVAGQSAAARLPFSRAPEVLRLADDPAREISAGQYLTWEWQPNNYRACHVEGRILGLTGGNKDVEVLLFDQDSYLNWKNNHQVNVYFQSGRQTATTLNLDVGGNRKYVLVISNVFSTLTAKTVQLQGITASCTD